MVTGISMHKAVNAHEYSRSPRAILEVVKPGFVLIRLEDPHTATVAPGLRSGKRGRPWDGVAKSWWWPVYSRGLLAYTYAMTLFSSAS